MKTTLIHNLRISHECRWTCVHHQSGLFMSSAKDAIYVGERGTDCLVDFMKSRKVHHLVILR